MNDDLGDAENEARRLGSRNRAREESERRAMVGRVSRPAHVRRGGRGGKRLGYASRQLKKRKAKRGPARRGLR